MIPPLYVQPLIDLHERTSVLDGQGPCGRVPERGPQHCWRPGSASTADMLSCDAVMRWIEHAYGSDPAGRRNVASAGALYPLRFYVLVPGRPGEVEATETVGRPHAVRTWPVGTVGGLELVRRSLKGALGTLCLIAADLEQPGFKYGRRGYRFALIEAGLAAQEITRVAADEHVQVRMLGAFDDAEVARSLGIAHSTVVPLAILAFHLMS